MNKTLIEWADYTWNPVTGCLKDCWYCYVKRIARYNTKPALHINRLRQPLRVQLPSKIFVCSTGDLFGDWVDSQWIEFVLKVVRECPHHTFQFLTKNPRRYSEFDFPKNCWLGWTQDGTQIYNQWDKNKSNIKFISFEPLIEPLNSNFYTLAGIDWIIIGAMTGQLSQKYQPKEEWIQRILSLAFVTDIPVFMKNNLKPIWKGKLRQEFPDA